ncbi:MAG: hypothetical protein IH851_11205 [Armatimonadetes bacterium]|nr:hypothetical protein [Armatimonadota bacterium]
MAKTRPNPAAIPAVARTSRTYKEKFLRDLTEGEFRSSVVFPLLQRQNIRPLSDTHGSDEEGKALTGYQVEIKWTRAGHDAVKLRGQRAGETVWTDLAVDTVSPYVDTRAPLVANTPEERRYQAAYLDDDLITSLWSDTLVVTAQG